MYGVMGRLNGLAYKKALGIVPGTSALNKIMCLAFPGCATVAAGGGRVREGGSPGTSCWEAVLPGVSKDTGGWRDRWGLLWGGELVHRAINGHAGWDILCMEDGGSREYTQGDIGRGVA